MQQSAPSEFIHDVPRRLDTASDAPRSTVALLRVDAGLRAAVPPDELPYAERVLVVPRRELRPGPWAPDTLLGDSARPFAALVLSGIVTHEVTLAGRTSANLLGPGDLFRPWRPVDSAVPCEERWTASEGAVLAVLDERLRATARRWPGLSDVIYDRLAEQLAIAAVRAAIVGLPRVEERILALFWQLADRWGIVRPDGVEIELELTHALIGRLVGAQRPTVTLALRELADQTLLRRDAAGAWTLSRDSVSALTPDADPRFGRRAVSGPAQP